MGKRDLVTLVLVALSACAADAGNGGGSELPDSVRQCGGANSPPAEICALRSSNELLECAHGPFRYKRERKGLLLYVQCHAYGAHEPTRTEFRRHIEERGDTSVSVDLAADASLWPAAPCELTYTIGGFSDIAQQFPDLYEAKTEIHTDGDWVRLTETTEYGVNQFTFAADECTRLATPAR